MSEYVRPFAEGIAHLSTREVADRARANERAVENWRQCLNGPSWKHVVAMLGDPVMRPILHRAAELSNDKRTAALLADIKERGT